MPSLATYDDFRAELLEHERVTLLLLRCGRLAGDATGRRYRYVGPAAPPPSEDYILSKWFELVRRRAEARAEAWLSPLRGTQSSPGESVAALLARLESTKAILALVDPEELAARLGLVLKGKDG